MPTVAFSYWQLLPFCLAPVKPWFLLTSALYLPEVHIITDKSNDFFPNRHGWSFKYGTWCHCSVLSVNKKKILLLAFVADNIVSCQLINFIGCWICGYVVTSYPTPPVWSRVFTLRTEMGRMCFVLVSLYKCEGLTSKYLQALIKVQYCFCNRFCSSSLLAISVSLSKD